MTCAQLSGPRSLRAETFDSVPLDRGTVRVRIGAAGVNFPDLLMTRGEYQYRPPLPFIPGMEGAGVITEVAPDVDALAIGQRVTINVRTGMFATECVVPAMAVQPAPSGFSMAEAACFRVATQTARHALVDRATLQPGETLLVLGAGGGVGLAAVEIGHLLGARVIAAASSADKLSAARARGAAKTIDYTQGDLVDQVRALAPDGVDVIFDPVGGKLFEQALRLPAWNGRVLVVGFASGTIGVAKANLPLIKGYSILGVRAGEAARRDPVLAERGFRQLAEWVERGHLRPHISALLPLSQAAAALESLESRRALGRIALVCDESIK